MEMVDLDIEMDNDLIAKTHDLALKYFGDDSDASLTQVLEMAFTMRCLWSRFVRIGQQETGEAISTWEFPESTIKRENSGSIQDWLFRR
ncbi:MAG: hypothetical protein HXY36_05980 [Chloroflexi bacterium]|nr:hypothetical protein [Chloroflexota bacterium]